MTIVRQSIINLEFHEHQDYLCMEGEWGKKKDFLKELLGSISKGVVDNKRAMDYSVQYFYSRYITEQKFQHILDKIVFQFPAMDC